MSVRLFLAVIAALVLSSSPAFAQLPASQNFNMGALTRAGYGGCNDSNVAGSTPFSNVQYTGTHPLVFSATSNSVSADSRYKIDSHNCLVPNGTYGGVPTVAPANGTYGLTDNNGATGNVVITVVANRWDVTNIDGGACTNGCSTTNADSTSSTQLINLFQAGDPSVGANRVSPAVGDSVYLRCGAVIDPPKFDSINGTTGVATPGDMRVKPHAYTGLDTSPGDLYAGYTALTLPSNLWINVTDEAPGCATIRHIQFNGTNRSVQGVRFTGLNFGLDYNGTNGFSQSTAMLTLGSGATTQSFVQVDNNTFQSSSIVMGQRGQQGITSTSVNDNGTSGCTSATIAYSDNHGGPTHGSGATATATIAGGVVTSWTQTATGSNYDSAHSASPGVPPASGAGTWATVTATGCTTAPTATPNMNGLDIVTGIFGAAGAGLGSTELYIHDNTFADMWDAVNLAGNQSGGGAYATPTNFWFIGNTCLRPWTACVQISSAAPAYTEWNFIYDFKYASGAFHNDCEIRLYSQLTSGQTYPFGDVIGNICVRADGQSGWADAQGWFMSNPVSGATMSGCKFEGNIYVGTFANGITLANCDSSAVVAFNTLVQDPATSITLPNQNGSASSSNSPLIDKYSTSATFNGQSSYNAVANATYVWTGGSPTATCNVPSLGLGSSTPSANAYAAPPANFTTLTSISAVVTAFSMKTGGTLASANLPNAGNPGGTCPYNAGTGGYFDYVNRVSTAPF